MEEVVMYTVDHLTHLLEESNVPPGEIASIIAEGNPYSNANISAIAVSEPGEPIKPINVDPSPVIYIVRDDTTNPPTHILKIEADPAGARVDDDVSSEVVAKVPPRNG